MYEEKLKKAAELSTIFGYTTSAANRSLDELARIRTELNRTTSPSKKVELEKQIDYLKNINGSLLDLANSVAIELEITNEEIKSLITGDFKAWLSTKLKEYGISISEYRNDPIDQTEEIIRVDPTNMVLEYITKIRNNT